MRASGVKQKCLFICVQILLFQLRQSQTQIIISNNVCEARKKKKSLYWTQVGENMARVKQNKKWRVSAGETPTSHIVREIKIVATTSARSTVDYLHLESCDPKFK